MPIARVTQGKDAYLCLNYVLTKDQAELLETNCATEQPATIAREFDLAFQPHQRNGAKKHVTNHVAHFSIGFHAPQSQETLIAVAHRFMALMGFDPILNQYVLAQHHDTDDCHLHLVENRIRLDGTVVSDSFQKKRAEVAMRTVETEFGLPQLKCSWEVDIKAPTVSEVRRSRQTGEPIPRQELQAILERTVSGCRTLEALQTALQVEGVALIMTPILPGVVTSRCPKRKGKHQGREEEPTGGLETGDGTGDKSGLEESDNVRPGTEGLSDRQPEALKTAAERHPKLTFTPTEPAVTQSQDPNPTRYQLVYQWTPPNGNVQTFSASALGKRYTQRGLQERWGVGLQGSALIDWAVQQTVAKLFAEPREDEMVNHTLPVPPRETGVASVETAETGQEKTRELQVLDQQPQDALSTGSGAAGAVAPDPVEAPPTDTTASTPTPSQQVAREYYQAAWLQLEQAYTQATGQTRATDPQFEAQVLRLAWEQWATDQCIAMLVTTANGQAHASQGKEVLTAYVQGLFDQLPAVQKQEAVKLDRGR